MIFLWLIACSAPQAITPPMPTTAVTWQAAPDDAIAIQITPGSVTLSGSAVATAPNTLRETLSAMRVPMHDAPSIAIHATPDVPYGEVARVVNEAGQAGVSEQYVAVSGPNGRSWIALYMPNIGGSIFAHPGAERCVTRHIHATSERLDARPSVYARLDAPKGDLLDAFNSGRWELQPDVTPTDEPPCEAGTASGDADTPWHRVVAALDALHESGHRLFMLAMPDSR